MTGIVTGLAICMLFTIQIAVGQPMAESSTAMTRARSQANMAELARHISTAPSAGVMHDQASPSSRSQSSATLIGKAIQTWVTTKPLPPLSIHDEGSYDGSYTAQTPNAADTAAPKWLTRLNFLFEAGEALQDATSFEVPGMLVALDPLNLRCTLTFRLDSGSVLSSDD